MSEAGAPTLFHRAWSLPKGGNTAQQNDDAWHIASMPGDPGPEGLLMALADGATEAIYSGQWARHLVQSAQPDWPLLGDTELNERLETVRASFTPLAAREEPLPWYVHDKLRTQGSQAALLVAAIVGREAGACFAINAVSVGDCCLLLLRANGELRAFPIESAADFGVHPALVGTRPSTPLSYARWEDQLHPGDVLLACTDAVAKWTLQCWETHQADALLGWLIRLLSSLDAEPGSIQTAPETDHCPSDPKLASRADRLNILALFVGRLRSWLGLKSKTKASRASSAAQKTIVEPGQPIVLQAKLNPAADFSEFIEANRAAKEPLRMRNDDSTLAICLPVGHAAVDREAEALHVIQRQLGLKVAKPEISAK